MTATPSLSTTGRFADTISLVEGQRKQEKPLRSTAVHRPGLLCASDPWDRKTRKQTRTTVSPKSGKRCTIIRHHQASVQHHQASSGIIRYHQASLGSIRHSHRDRQHRHIRHHWTASDALRYETHSVKTARVMQHESGCTSHTKGI